MSYFIRVPVHTGFPLAQEMKKIIKFSENLRKTQYRIERIIKTQEVTFSPSRPFMMIYTIK